MDVLVRERKGVEGEHLRHGFKSEGREGLCGSTKMA